ncbi:major facilitator superfamily domain-containing protein [Gymnopilus junonius]|uniref:Major facilitator superfamily domain-containing protein n=1 Tax=Gymnopilus junonius TaxID=109634 RepID=A0A9P5NFE0_GYMJU|nr:major facilitator superfamily domain-containing protein [Gymnopilus junonius]
MLIAANDLTDEHVSTISTTNCTRPSLMDSNRCTGASKGLSAAPTIVLEQEVSFDIEHVPVKDDPRAWSPVRKNATLLLIAFASMIAALSANIQNPAIKEMEAELPATSSQFSLNCQLVYVVSVFLFTIGSIIVALSHGIGPVIGLRALQAAGSSAVMAIGAASLADIFDPEERGRKMGIYYVAPLLGPAIGPILGGFLTAVWDWRAIFWFLSIFGGSIFIAFIFLFKDTFRKERSLIYQSVLKRRLRDAAIASPPEPNVSITVDKSSTVVDVEKDVEVKTVDLSQIAASVNLSITDVNPFKPLGLVLRRKNNLLVLVCSGVQFAYAFVIVYATSRTLETSYNYGPLKIGLVTLSFGIGCAFGSVLGGRWSDRELARLKAANGGQSYPEMRLKSTRLGIFFLPPFVLGYGWLCREKVHISAICIFLFLGGFFSIWMYAITLAYIVDSNTGRSSTAVATNSAFRGSFACIATEIVVPIQDNLGDGWLYTIVAAVLALTSAGMILLARRGAQWREAAELREKRKEVKSTSLH